MKALTLAALLILGSTAYASDYTKWQALQRKYAAVGVPTFDGLDKAKFLCLCYEQGYTSALGFFEVFSEEHTWSEGGLRSTGELQ